MSAPTRQAGTNVIGLSDKKAAPPGSDKTPIPTTLFARLKIEDRTEASPPNFSVSATRVVVEISERNVVICFVFPGR